MNLRFFLVVVVHLVVAETQLVVNVKTQGGEVFKETITANISDDSVMLEFPQNDGTYITQLIDFKQVCIAWYPCGLKYCKGRDNSGKAVSYRCGIRTCRRCRNFSYFVPQRQLCLWDD
ncbi:Out at first protein [Portunus trituberculatus]|uniref:Out at first protein n=1 Tax=Portunus trituberculatus TaxID=210409 RepID=A0A5B7E9Y6_PORTR|nr:Out at first protein [Portunus trituberculatus]